MVTEPNAYDEVPYDNLAFAQTHPDRLATTARMFGLEPPPIATARVLELGCASGGNLIPMAFNLPDGEFVGIDLSRRHVDTALSTIACAEDAQHSHRPRFYSGHRRELGSLRLHHLPRRVLVGRAARAGRHPDGLRATIWSRTASHTSATTRIPAGICARRSGT